jgi:hypothetical protein
MPYENKIRRTGDNPTTVEFLCIMLFKIYLPLFVKYLLMEKNRGVNGDLQAQKVKDCSKYIIAQAYKNKRKVIIKG